MAQKIPISLLDAEYDDVNGFPGEIINGRTAKNVLEVDANLNLLRNSSQAIAERDDNVAKGRTPKQADLPALVWRALFDKVKTGDNETLKGLLGVSAVNNFDRLGVPVTLTANQKYIKKVPKNIDEGATLTVVGSGFYDKPENRIALSIKDISAGSAFFNLTTLDFLLNIGTGQNYVFVGIEVDGALRTPDTVANFAANPPDFPFAGWEFGPEADGNPETMDDLVAVLNDMVNVNNEIPTPSGTTALSFSWDDATKKLNVANTEGHILGDIIFQQSTLSTGGVMRTPFEENLQVDIDQEVTVAAADEEFTVNIVMPSVSGDVEVEIVEKQLVAAASETDTGLPVYHIARITGLIVNDTA